VVALEQDAALAQRARENLTAIGAHGVAVVTGPLTQGWPAQAPYDVIFLNGASEIAPETLFRQLKDGGRLVGVIRPGRPGRPLFSRSPPGGVRGRPVFDASGPLLPGFAAP